MTNEVSWWEEQANAWHEIMFAVWKYYEGPPYEDSTPFSQWCGLLGRISGDISLMLESESLPEMSSTLHYLNKQWKRGS